MSEVNTATRLLKFDAAHRVLMHESKCKYLHGHEYRVEITAQASFGTDRLDALGRVVDFGVIKQVVGSWIDDKLDHNTILNPADPILTQDIYAGLGDQPGYDQPGGIIGREPFVMPEEYANPTAENIAAVIFVTAGILLVDYNVSITNVRVWETQNCYADYRRED